MKKKILSVLIAFILTIFVAVPAFASNYVIGSSSFSTSENTQIDTIADNIKSMYGIEVYLTYSDKDGSAKELAHKTIENIKGEYIVYAVTNDYYCLKWSSGLDDYFKEGDRDEIWNTIGDYESQGLYTMSIQYYSKVSQMLSQKGVPITGSTLETTTLLDSKSEGITLNKPNKLEYVVDQVGVLSKEDAEYLNERLKTFREENKFDLVIVTVTGLDPNDRMSYADDYYDYNGYGYGDNKDGALLLVNVYENGSYSTGNSWISTTGSGISYINDSDIQSIGSTITPYLLDCDYNRAFNKTIDLVGKEIKSSDVTKKGIIASVALVVGLIGAFGYTSTLKKQLKTAQEANEANNYLVDGSLYLSKQYDHYLYTNVTKTAKPKESSSGSSTHSGSSGTSHGGGGF